MNLKEFTGKIEKVGVYSIVVTMDGKVKLSLEIDLVEDLGLLLKVDQKPDAWYSKVFALAKAWLGR